MSKPSELGLKQELFAKCLGQLLAFIHNHPTWRARLQEGYVGTTDAADGDYDGPHLKGGGHYNKVAIDIAMFLVDTEGGRVALTTAHPVWDELGRFWKSLHPECRWGGDFAHRDYNHFSIEYGGKA